MGVQIPAQAIADSQAAGELWQVVLAIAGPESSWRADAIGDAGCSIGYLQFNMCGGLGTGIAKETLLHGPTNMRLGAEYIRGRLARGDSLWDAMQPWSARPAAYELYQQILSEGIEGVSTPGGSVLQASGNNTVIVLLAAAAAIILLSEV
jgi:hypothetical protein